MLPIFHGQNLENGDKTDQKCVVVGSRLFFVRSKVKFSLENLSSQKGVDEYEEEHETGDVEEIHERATDDAHDDLHRPKGSQKTSHSQNAECTENAHSSKRLQTGGTPWPACCFCNHFNDGKHDNGAVKDAHFVGEVLFDAHSQKSETHFDDKNPGEHIVELGEHILRLRLNRVAIHGHRYGVQEDGKSEEILENAQLNEHFQHKSRLFYQLKEAFGPNANLVYLSDNLPTFLFV